MNIRPRATIAEVAIMMIVRVFLSIWINLRMSKKIIIKVGRFYFVRSNLAVDVFQRYSRAIDSIAARSCSKALSSSSVGLRLALK